MRIDSGAESRASVASKDREDEDMALEEKNPFRDQTADERSEMLTLFLKAEIGSEDEFDDFLALGSRFYESMAARTPEEAAADHALAERLVKVIFSEDSESNDSA